MIESVSKVAAALAPPEPSWTEELDTAGCADALAEARREVLAAEANRLRLVSRWIMLHSAAPGWGKDAPPAGERAVPAGAEGTPLVREFAADALGLHLQCSTRAAQQLMADVANLQFRHPRLWAAVHRLRIPGWLAIKTARMATAADLTCEQAHWLDAQLVDEVEGLPPGRYLDLVQAAILQADEAKAAAKRAEAAMARFVRKGRVDEHGLTHLIARAAAGDIARFYALVDRIAEILDRRGDTDPVDVRRSKALGILAAPGMVVELLTWDADRPAAECEPSEEAPAEDAADEAGEQACPALGAPMMPEPSPEETAAVAAARAGERAAEQAYAREQAVRAGFARPPVVIGEHVDPKLLRPQAVLYVHFPAESLSHLAAGPAGGTGIARVEDVGPVLLGQVRDWLGHDHVTIKPVIDLAGATPVDAYEVPDRMRELVELRSPYETFPWATLSSRRTDKDHSVPYVAPDRGGPPGQTDPDKLGALGRRHHRVKTHGMGWKHRQLSRDVHWWRTPTLHWYATTPHGSRAVAGISPLAERFVDVIAGHHASQRSEPG